MGVANEVSAGVGIPKGGEAARNVAVGDTFTIHYSLLLLTSRQPVAPQRECNDFGREQGGWGSVGWATPKVKRSRDSDTLPIHSSLFALHSLFPPPRRGIMFVQKSITLFTIHFYILLRASPPRPKGSETTLGGVKGVWGL